MILERLKAAKRLTTLTPRNLGLKGILKQAQEAVHPSNTGRQSLVPAYEQEDFWQPAPAQAVAKPGKTLAHYRSLPVSNVVFSESSPVTLFHSFFDTVACDAYFALLNASQLSLSGLSGHQENAPNPVCPVVKACLHLQTHAALATAKSNLAKEDIELERFHTRGDLTGTSGRNGQSDGASVPLLDSPLANTARLQAEPDIQQRVLLLRLPPHFKAQPGGMQGLKGADLAQ